MLRYKTQTRPGLVALYNIRPGNEACMGPTNRMKNFVLASWNVHTLTDSNSNPKCRTAILALEIATRSSDIAALSELHFDGESSLAVVDIF